MKKIEIKKSNPLYRLFEWISGLSYFYFICEDEKGNINSFNDVCTFINHCFLIFLNILIILIFTFSIIMGILIVLGLVGLTLYLAVTSAYAMKFSYTQLSFILFPLVTYYAYNKILSGTGFTKFAEIIAAHDKTLCVKIDVIDDK